MSLDSPNNIQQLRRTIQSKSLLKNWYTGIYERYRNCLSRCPPTGIMLEIGSGAGFVKELIPDIVTSDIIPYDGLDRIVDCTKMDFAENSIRAIFMLNVFHHIPDVSRFFKEATRVLVAGGRIFMVDQHVGWLSRFLLKYLHHEGFDPATDDWRFHSDGPLSSANGALAWMVFRRDVDKFRTEYPELEILQYTPHSPLQYWLSGGLRNWSLVPEFGCAFVNRLDRFLISCSSDFGSFTDIEIVKRGR